MPWQVTGNTVIPSTNQYVAASDGDGLTFMGSNASGPRDVGLTFVDQSQPYMAYLGFANAPNAWMMGLTPGDVGLMSRMGRVHIGGGPATATPQLMVCNADKSPSGRGGLYLKGSISFTGDPNVGTGEFLVSERDGSRPNATGLDLYTDYSARLSITRAGQVGIGTQSPSAALEVVGDVRVSGDILLANADCAEDFETAASVTIDPGTVVVLDDGAMLRESANAYDGRVAGVVSGAGDFRPALRLNHQADAGVMRVPVALVGRVMCKVDADRAPITVGDLLTTSDIPGHAMKATDRNRAFGAILGKAMAHLAAGRGLIPVLVALQ